MRGKKGVMPKPRARQENVRRVFSFYKLRNEVLVPFLLRHLIKSKRQQLLSTGDNERRSKSGSTKSVQSKKSSNNKKSVPGASAAPGDDSEVEVSHNEEWSGWDNHED